MMVPNVWAELGGWGLSLCAGVPHATAQLCPGNFHACSVNTAGLAGAPPHPQSTLAAAGVGQIYPLGQPPSLELPRVGGLRGLVGQHIGDGAVLVASPRLVADTEVQEMSQAPSVWCWQLRCSMSSW